MSNELAPSQEQAEIIRLITEGQDVVANCVAGAGKTTSILFLAKRFPNKRILHLTYNNELKSDNQLKAQKWGVKNVNSYTFHGLYVNIYDSKGYVDSVIREGLLRNIAPRNKIPHFDIIVVDECQDMNSLYYNLLKKFIRDSGVLDYQMLVLGDRWQAIYEFLGADSRFLTLCSKIWEREFIPVSLSTSYRLTNQVSAFINEVMLGRKRILTNKEGPRVKYIVDDIFKCANYIAAYLVNEIRKGVLRPDDIFILAGSIKNDRSPIRLLENALVEMGIPCYYPTSDDHVPDKEVIRGKIVFGTFNSSKGRERETVVIYGFDESYYKFFGKDLNPKVCPQILYVANTRPLNQLILVHNYKNAPLPFLKKNLREIAYLPYVEYIQLKCPLINNPGITMLFEDKKHTSPTELVKHISESNMNLITDIMKQIITVESPPIYSVDIPSKITCSDGNVEEISDINGVVIPAIYELRHRGHMTIEEDMRLLYHNICVNGEHTFLQNSYNSLGDTITNTVGFIRLGIMYLSLKEKIYNKIQQIDKYDWLTNEMIEGCFQTLSKFIPEDAKYERSIEYKSTSFPEFGSVKISGRIDVMNEEIVYEFKCTDTLTTEHQLQLLLYAWMWKHEHMDDLGFREFKLVNIRTGEVHVLDTESHLIEEAVAILLNNKYGVAKKLDDTQFINACKLEIPLTAMPFLTPPSSPENDTCLFVED